MSTKKSCMFLLTADAGALGLEELQRHASGAPGGVGFHSQVQRSIQDSGFVESSQSSNQSSNTSSKKFEKNFVETTMMKNNVNVKTVACFHPNIHQLSQYQDMSKKSEYEAIIPVLRAKERFPSIFSQQSV